MPARWTTSRVEVVEASQVGEARRVARSLAELAGLDETAAGTVALVVTEAATNLVKHARGGQVLLRALDDGVDVLAIDRGPGMDVSRCLRDGFSTSGTSGQGLGAIRRLASAFAVYSGPGGTVLWAPVRRAAPALDVGAACVPLAGELECGDGWALDRSGARPVLLVVDGLGHGFAAAVAAAEAVRAFARTPGQSLAARLDEIHRALRSTRGAAASLVELDLATREVVFAGVGNVAGTVLGPAPRSLVSLPGTLGMDARRVQEFRHAWPPGAPVVVFTDGIVSRWSLDKLPGLAARPAAVVAGALFRDWARGRDDATVVVVKAPPVEGAP